MVNEDFLSEIKQSENERRRLVASRWRETECISLTSSSPRSFGRKAHADSANSLGIQHGTYLTDDTDTSRV
jgi:hypothetical protein